MNGKGYHLLVWLVMVTATNAAAGFDADFTGATLRLDLFHTGQGDREIVSLDRARIEGPWPGSRTQLLDPLGRGKYLVEVVDAASSRPLYSRGFASIYGEWETIGEAAAGVSRTIPEAVRIPAPRRPVQVRLRKRGDDQAMREIWSVVIDPADRSVDRSPVPDTPVRVLQERGDPAVKVDLLFLGDGYRREDLLSLREDARRLTEELFQVEPFLSRRDDFNVRLIETPTEEAGISRPRAGIYRRTALGTSYNTFDSERYVLTLDDRRWRDVAAAAPYDAVVILVNERKYGGGGIYNLYATAAASSSFSSYLVVHEFGHSFAGLGDEYYTSSVAYEADAGPPVEPWEPNLTALEDPGRVKWAEQLTPGIPVPTPWVKEEYEKRSTAFQERRQELRAAGAPEEELEALFREEQELFTLLLGGDEHAGEVGAFEGGGYRARGIYRPSVDCIMFTRDPIGFCRVCRRAIEDVIDLYSR